MERPKTKIVLLSLLLFMPIMAFAGTVTAGFSPQGNSVELVQRAIESAHESIDVAAYTFTSHKIADALIAARQRGVDVQIVLDAKANKRGNPGIEAMQAAGIPIRLNGHYAIMHDKYMIIDGKTVETGSFNFTASAEIRNAENVVIINDNYALAKKYQDNWQTLWDEGSGLTEK